MYIRLIGSGERGILEPFYDGGEAYREYHKYETIKNYTVIPQDAAMQYWMSVNFRIKPHSVVTAQRECNINLGRFDEIYVEAKIPDYINLRLIINGIEIINKAGTGEMDEYFGKTAEKDIKSIKIEFSNNGENLYDAMVTHIGVRDSKFPSEEEIKGKNTVPDWEGCFEKNPEIKLLSGSFTESGEKLREKMKSPFFKATYERTKKFAQMYMDKCPEENIGNVITADSDQFYSGAATLAFIGFIEKDMNMLKMAARYALSLASIKTWYQEEKELAVGITWNGRVFQTAYASFGISLFLEFGGSILTWHGKNYLYEALAVKGLSRLDGDFKRMEYIYHMNQGLAFSPGYIYALLALCVRFPRYKKRIEEIEEDVFEMLSGTVNPDGGMVEGLGYYSYTIESYCLTAYALASFRGKSISDYIGGRLEKASNFALAMTGGNNTFRTVGDAGRYGFAAHICMFMYQATENPVWAKYYRDCFLKNPDGQLAAGWYLGYLIYGEEINRHEDIKEDKGDKFYCFPDCGYTYLKRDEVEFFSISGKSFSHCHSDKGSFTVDVCGEPVLIDRGMCGYSKACADEISASAAHNMAVPVAGGYMLNQNSQHGYSSQMKLSRFENGFFEWVCDNDNVWDKSIVRKNVRTIKSNNPYEYEITDEFEFEKPTSVAFLLNMYSDKGVSVKPINWKPVFREYKEYSVDYAEKPVMRLELLSEEGTSLRLVTVVRIDKHAYIKKA